MASRTITLYVKQERFPLLYGMKTLRRVLIYVDDENGKVIGYGSEIEPGNTLERERFIN